MFHPQSICIWAAQINPKMKTGRRDSYSKAWFVFAGCAILQLVNVLSLFVCDDSRP
jgi:hypothetical protein